MSELSLGPTSSIRFWVGGPGGLAGTWLTALSTSGAGQIGSKTLRRAALSANWGTFSLWALDHSDKTSAESQLPLNPWWVKNQHGTD
jgi:hypothetical protein